MSTLLYSGKTFQGRSEHRIPVPPSQLLVDVSIGIFLDGGCSAVVTSSGTYNLVTPAARDTTLDLYFDLDAQGSYPTVTVTLLGGWANVILAADTTDTLDILTTLLGAYVAGIGTDDGLLDVTIKLKPDEDYIFFASAVKKNWVKWSNIGSLDFTVWKDNIAGERPLDWKGLIYAVKKLGNKVIAYGENGVSVLIPAGNTYGLYTVHRIGLKGKQAVAGNKHVQFFVDTSGYLFFLGESSMKSALFEASMYPKKLDYSEFLSGMADIVLSWDEENNLLYICDGATGYVYSLENNSLGAGPTNITGIGSQGSSLYVVAPTGIVTPSFEICTDIYDYGTHKYKTIHELEFGTNVTGTLQARIDYRSDITIDFSQTDWKDVSSKGNVFITALGREFRYRIKITEYEYLELDYITARGIIHDH